MGYATKEEMRNEAIERMKILDMYEPVIRDFEKEGRLYRSEFMGILYWLSDEEKKLVKEFEEERESVVYHVILSETSIGTLYSMLYVSKYMDDWEYDRKDLSNKENLLPTAYVYNVDGGFGEAGSIGIKTMNGGLVRIS